MKLSHKLVYALEFDELMVKLGSVEVLSVDVKTQKMFLSNNSEIEIDKYLESDFKVFKIKELEPYGNIIKFVKALKKVIKTHGTEKSRMYVTFFDKEISTIKELIQIVNVEDYEDLNYVQFYKLKEKKNYLLKEKKFIKYKKEVEED